MFDQHERSVSVLLSNVVSNIVGTVIGGLLLAAFLLWLAERWFPPPNLSGVWRFDAHIHQTAFNPYRGMRLTYLILLSQEGLVIRGSGEKVRENVKGQIRTYEAAHRSRIEISGSIRHRYFRASTAVIHILETAPSRESSTLQTVEVARSGRLIGEFTSTIANSSGSVIWKRGKGDLTFLGKM